MDTIIGLGKGGCNIAKNFEQYPQYNTICIDTENAGYANFLRLPKQDSHEDYEANYTALDLGDCGDHVGFFCVGSGRISGVVLRVLEQIKDKKVWVYLIKADPTDLSEKGRLRERATFFILQEFARCGLLDRLYILDNKRIEAHLEEVSILNYWEKINEAVSSTIHMLNYFSNTPSVMTTVSAPPEPAKIQTLGFVDVETGSENLFYDLQFPRHRLYYYAINQDKLETDAKLLTAIKQQMQDQTTENCMANYSIYGTTYQQNYCYVELFSSFIQEQYLPER
jgi:hypothetical protein